MKSILVVDDTAICREPIVAVLRQEGYDAVGAAGGTAALESVAARRPDLLLLDLQMPGMDGWAVLRAIRKMNQCQDLPVILLTGTVNKQCVVRARELGVQEYLLKSAFSLPEMIARVRKHLGAVPATVTGAASAAVDLTTTKAEGLRDAELQGMPLGPASEAGPDPVGPTPKIKSNDAARKHITRDDIVARLEACTQAKTLAGVVAEVVSLAGSRRGSLADLVSVLKRDPVVCTRVLQLANTAGFASAKPTISTIEEAVRNIGAGAVRNTAASLGIFESFSATAADGAGLVRCWQHSFAVAALMDRLVPANYADDHGAAYLVGLCHDLAEIVLRQHFPQEYEAAIDLAAASAMPIADAQSSFFGMPQHQLVGLILSRLGLPESISGPIQSYFRRSIGADGDNAEVLVRALALADQYAHGLLLASAGDAPVGPVTEVECRKIVGKTDMVIDGPGLRGEVVATTGHLTRASADEQESLFRPLFAPTGVKVWYARHPSLAALDPLGAAMGFLADVRSHDRLPSGVEDLGDSRALVVALPRANLAARWLDDVKLLVNTQPERQVLLLVPMRKPRFDTIANLVVAEYPLPLARLHKFLSEL